MMLDCCKSKKTCRCAIRNEKWCPDGPLGRQPLALVFAALHAKVFEGRQFHVPIFPIFEQRSHHVIKFSCLVRSPLLIDSKYPDDRLHEHRPP